MQVPHADLADTVYMYRYLGARLLWYRAASAADLDLAMPVIGLFGAGAQGSRNGGKGVTERAQFPGSVRGCRAARAGKGGMTAAPCWCLSRGGGTHSSQTTHVTFHAGATSVAACGCRNRWHVHMSVRAVPPRSSSGYPLSRSRPVRTRQNVLAGRHARKGVGDARVLVILGYHRTTL
jgi:hypothetical protein